jgi:hypothetical protein
MEGEHDDNHKAPQIPKSQTACGVADCLDSAPVGPGVAARRVKLEFARRPIRPDLQRKGRAIRRIGGSARAYDGGAAAAAGIVAARDCDHGELIASDRLAEPRSLTQELIVTPRQQT